MVSRRPQMVLVHVDVGTANLGGSVHNAARSRIPAIILAGRSPVTVNGELAGSRTEFIHWIQDTTHQADIVRPYVKWLYEMRAEQSAESVFQRAYQIAASEPQGPVYLTGAREKWDLTGPAVAEDGAQWPAAGLGTLPDDAAARIAAALAASRRPLVITSYYGRHPDAVPALVQLSERVGIAVCEMIPQAVSFPGSHPHHVGYELGRHVSEADLILLLDVDVPWLPAMTGPASDARVFHIDCDPLKPAMGLWHFPAEEARQADSHAAIEQIPACLADSVAGRDERSAWIASLTPQPAAQSAPPASGLTSAAVAETLRELSDDRTVFLNVVRAGTCAVVEVLLRPISEQRLP